MSNIAEFAAALAPHGLIVRGGFDPAPDDGVPGDPATLVMVGNAGPAMWRAFDASEFSLLDEWTRDVLDDVAAAAGATALYPFGGPPYHPFQRWAQRADAVAPSPIGVLIHPEYGLWHAYRGALAFADRLALPARDGRPVPCETCADKPCLGACPVAAFATGGYDVPVCIGHIGAPAGADCMAAGCAARRACPVGRDYAYAPAHAAFHMAAFLRANR